VRGETPLRSRDLAAWQLEREAPVNLERVKVSPAGCCKHAHFGRRATMPAPARRTFAMDDEQTRHSAEPVTSDA
jgi:hypothetical protein